MAKFNFKELCTKLEETKLLPLYTATDLQYLSKLEEILIDCNLPLVEVTFRSDLASQAIKELSKSNNLIVGAGTVRTVDEVKIAMDSGAQFIVSPAIDSKVVEYCIDNNIPIFPGTAVPSDIQQALNYGIKVVKFFPANVYGGLTGIKALSGPFYDVKFLPTGGIDKSNVSEYVASDCILAVGGSFIISEKLIAKDNGLSAKKELEEIMNIVK